MTGVTLFRSTDAGAAVLSGQVGKILDVLDQCLVINKVFATANDSAFTDNSVEARLVGGTAFPLFPTPATTDRTYFGMSRPFYNLTFTLTTPGTSATYVWEHWDGAAWTAFTPTADGTSGLTTSGKVTWSVAGTPTWATTTINSVVQYYVRVRFTGSSPSTNPTVSAVTALGWTRTYSGTNKAVYKQGGGQGFYCRVDDNGPHASALAKEAQFRGYETMSDIDTGTGLFPTVVQFGPTAAASGLALRKSVTADSVARPWLVVTDDRTAYVFISSGDTANIYKGHMFGSIYSNVANDGFGCGIIGGGANDGSSAFTDLENNLSTFPLRHFLARPYLGLGSASPFGKHSDYVKGATTTMGVGALQYPNPPDGGLYWAPMWVHEYIGNLTCLRGRLRGMWSWLHVTVALADGDVFTGSGALAGKTLLAIKFVGGAANTGVCTLEISDTWDTN